MGKQVIYKNGTILTMEDYRKEVEAVLTEDGKITAMGSLEEMSSRISEQVEVKDLKGRTMLPAFLDAHSHFLAYANSLLQVSLEETYCFEDIRNVLCRYLEENPPEPGAWITAVGFDQNQMKEKCFPDRKVLDEAVPNFPLVIQHKSGHSGVFNSMGLRCLGVQKDTVSPQGGKIAKDDNGQPNGYMEEKAFLKYLQEVPMASRDKLENAIQKAQSIYASYGISTVQEGMLTEQMIPLYQYLCKEKKLRLDVVAYMDMKSEQALLEAFPDHDGVYRDHFKLGGYKIFLDGSPQGMTAWMRTPYLQGPAGYYGYPVMEDQEVRNAVQKSLTTNRQILAHCNGDAAAEQYIRIFEQCVEEGYTIGNRPVMVHAQLLGKDQIPRVKRLTMIPTFFVAHVYHWGDVHIQNFGKERADHISPAGSALETELPFTFHQDAPVIAPDMLETVWCAVNRRTKSGVLLGNDERISVEEALKAITIHTAYQYSEEMEKGSIAVGKSADFVILDQNPLTTDPKKIREIQVLETIKAGETIYWKES